MKPIPYGRQSISEDDIASVVAVLKSDFLTQGPAIQRLEEAIAAYCGVKHAVAVCNATAALHVACAALELGSGDVLWTSPNSFVASANCARYCGADVDFVDIDPRTLNLDPAALRAKLEKTKASGGRLPKIVVPVHFSGLPCEMEELGRLAREYGFTILEDASHAIGARYRDKPIGDCRHSIATVFSLHPVKIITSGEGGLVTTNDTTLYRRLCRLRSHGITRDESEMTAASHGPWYYQQLELGFNYRLTDLQAALGLSQLARLDEFVRRRHEIADTYDKAFRELPLELLARAASSRSALHLYVVRLTAASQVSRAELFARLREKNVLANVHYIPIHLQPYYRGLGFRDGQFPVAEAFYGSAVSLPMYPGLSSDEQAHVIETVRAALKPSR